MNRPEGKPLAEGYRAEIDCVDETAWNRIVDLFSDANLYQTWAYGEVHWGRRQMTHLVLRKDEKIRAAVQCRVVKFPGVKAGIAYLYRGPMWMLRGERPDSGVLIQIARAMVNEYAISRGMVLRIRPNLIDDESSHYKKMLCTEDLIHKPNGHAYRTLYIDLTKSINQFLAGMSKDWRKNIRRSEREPTEVLSGTDDRLYSTFLRLYEEMHARKHFLRFVDVHKYGLVQRKLPETQKMRLLIAIQRGHPVSAIVYADVGDTGLILFSATVKEGLKTRASHLLRLRMIEELKATGRRCLDQGGINPERFPGGYYYKLGFGGRDVRHIGQYDACFNPLSAASVRLYDLGRQNMRRLKSTINKVRKG